MKRLFYFLFVCSIGFIGCNKNFVSIPDKNFEQALIDLGYDDQINGKVLAENIRSIDSLYVFSKNISDLTGIEAFTALTDLSCYDNQLTALNLSNNTNLNYLECSWNNLTNLDASNSNDLYYLFCGWNNLTSLDLSNNTALAELNCGNNQITTLDLSHNTALTGLLCFDNQLTSLDLSNNTALTQLNCDDNNFDCDALKAKYNLE